MSYNKEIANASVVVGPENTKTRADVYCNGTNDQETINEAALSAEDGSLVLLNGTYNISHQIQLPSNIVFSGCGPGTIIKPYFGFYGEGIIYNKDRYTGGNENITIRDLQIDGNRAIVDPTLDNTVMILGIHMMRVENALIENCYVHDVNTIGIFGNFTGTMATPSKNITVRNCRCENNIGGGAWLNFSQGIAFSCEGGLAEGCYVQNCPLGIRLEQAPDARVSNCYIKDTSKGITVSLYTTKNWIVEGCTIKNSSLHGIHVTEKPRYGVISACNINAPGGHGIHFTNSTDVATITGNYVHGCNVGMYVTCGNIVGNVVAYNTTGISTLLDSGDYFAKLLISGNQINWNDEQAIYGSGSEKVIITDNYILYNNQLQQTGTQFASVYLDTGQHFRIKNNIIRGGRPRYCITVNNATNIEIVDNDFESGIDGVIYDPNTNITHCVRNRGYRTENIGTATMLAANTSVVVTHYLAFTPVAKHIHITANGPLGAASYFYVANINATTFTIHFDTAPGVDVLLGWAAQKII